MASPIFPWIGGKRRLAKHLLPRFPQHQTYVEPFCGAAALYFMKTPSKGEVLNDINGELINLYRVLQHHLDEFVRQFRWALSSRQTFDWLQVTPPETLTDIQRAARFYYLQKAAFGGKVSEQTFGTACARAPRVNLLRIEESLSQAHLRLANATIEHLPWQSCLQKYDRTDTLFYCDPPYWQTTGYGVEFGFEEYRKLAGALQHMKGKAIVTVNDIPEMREVFAAFAMTTVNLRYTVGGSKADNQRASELIIHNF
ncbi:DNA adenine methylase [Providencia rettgeri]